MTVKEGLSQRREDEKVYILKHKGDYIFLFFTVMNSNGILIDLRCVNYTDLSEIHSQKGDLWGGFHKEQKGTVFLYSVPWVFNPKTGHFNVSLQKMSDKPTEIHNV